MWRLTAEKETWMDEQGGSVKQDGETVEAIKLFGEEEGRADTRETQSAIGEIVPGCQRGSTMCRRKWMLRVS